MACIAAGKPRARQPAEDDAGASSRRDNAALGFPAATLRATISEAWAALSLARDASASRRSRCLAHASDIVVQTISNSPTVSSLWAPHEIDRNPGQAVKGIGGQDVRRLVGRPLPHFALMGAGGENVDMARFGQAGKGQRQARRTAGGTDGRDADGVGLEVETNLQGRLAGE